MLPDSRREGKGLLSLPPRPAQLLRKSGQTWGDPRRGGERGSPYGPAPGGQSRVRYPRKPSCNRGKLPAGQAEAQRVAVPSPYAAGPRVHPSRVPGQTATVFLPRPGATARPDGRVARGHATGSIDRDNESITARASQNDGGPVQRNHGPLARTRKPGTHARPAAGGVPWQANSGAKSAGSTRALAIVCLPRQCKGARLVARSDVSVRRRPWPGAPFAVRAGIRPAAGWPACG